MAGYTPGPWKMVDIRDYRGNVTGFAVWQDLERPYSNSPRGKRICATPDGSTKENEANARLMAAAPDLLNALTFYFSICGNTCHNITRQTAQEMYDMAKAAIAKAQGE